MPVSQFHMLTLASIDHVMSHNARGHQIKFYLLQCFHVHVANRIVLGGMYCETVKSIGFLKRKFKRVLSTAITLMVIILQASSFRL